MQVYTCSSFTMSSGSKISEESALCPYLFKNVRKLNNEFSLIESLGKGGFGRIFKARRRFDEKDFAIKIIKFECNTEDAEKYKREAKMLSSLDHNNIVRYYNSWIETAQIPRSKYEALKSDSENSLSSEISKLSENGYIKNQEEEEEEEEEDDDENMDIKQDSDSSTTDDAIIFKQTSDEFVELKYLFIQMELCDKRTLKTAIDDNLCQSEEKITKYFKEICEGLLHMHNIHVVHRDLKPQNIFLTSKDVIKIGDFGLSKQIALPCELENSSYEEPHGSLTDVCGTAMYIAPELYTEKTFNKKADIYSLGIIYFEMCSKPMTEMEKSKTFPLSPQRLKTINFLQNNFKKHFLLRSMTNPNYKLRPTCDAILKILNAEQSIIEVKKIMHRNKQIPHQQIDTFGNGLRLNSIHKINCTDFFLKTAVEIFKLHGAQNISVPTFLPSFTNHCDNLTTLLNVNGNSVSVSNTSRIGFAHFVAQNKKWDLRRYSTEKIFEEGYFLPTERQECVFEAVSSQSNDSVNDAEVLRIAKDISDSAFKNDKTEIYFFINHKHIFSTILKHCRIIEDENATLFTNIMIDLSKKITEEDISSSLSGLHLHYNTTNFLLKIWGPLEIKTAQRELTKKFKSRFKHLQTAVEQLNLLVLNASRFGIKTENIFLSPLLMVDRIYCGFMFKVELKGKAVIATGGRFDSLIQQCVKQKRDRPRELSAVGISFMVDNVVKLLRGYNQATFEHTAKVFIYAMEKATAIPLFKRLLDHKIPCQIITYPVQSVHILIHLRNEDNGTIYVRKRSSTYSGIWEMTVVYDGSWNNADFVNIIQNEIYSRRFQQLSPSNAMVAM